MAPNSIHREAVIFGHAPTRAATARHPPASAPGVEGCHGQARLLRDRRRGEIRDRAVSRAAFTTWDAIIQMRSLFVGLSSAKSE